MEVDPAGPGIHPAECDVLLRGGRVVDPETGLDSLADVSLRDGKIASVGCESARAARVIDITGLVVAPGFIDLHSHAQTIPSMRLQALDGVTTALELEAGVGDVNAAYTAASEAGRPINYGYSTSWAQARMKVIEDRSPTIDFLQGMRHVADPGWQRVADDAEIARILSSLEAEIHFGALGIGIMVGYAPQTGRAEFMRVAGIASRYDVPTFTHARFKNPDDPGSALEGAAEVVAAAAGTGAHMHLCHINSTSLRAIDEVADLVDGARDRGLSLTTEAYPYGAGMTAVGAPQLSPPNLRRVGVEASDLLIVETGERPATYRRLQEIREDTPGKLAIIHYLDETDDSEFDFIRRALMLRDTAVASDAIPFVTPAGRIVDGDQSMPTDAISHPRTAGTFSRYLRVMVRETQLLSLNDAIRRCSLLPAQFLQNVSPGMLKKGRIQVGCDADLVVFDPTTISDMSTYTAPSIPSRGFRHVFVGGVAVVHDGLLASDSMPGRAIVGKTW